MPTRRKSVRFLALLVLVGLGATRADVRAHSAQEDAFGVANAGQSPVAGTARRAPSASAMHGAAAPQASGPVAARLLQVRRIPSVVGRTAKDAIDSLSWTRLVIVQRDTITTRVAAGRVVAQRPRAGTPVSAVRAETLLVAATMASRPGAVTVGGAAIARARALAAVTPPPTRAPDDVAHPGANVTVTVPTDSLAITVPGVRVQDRTRVPDLHGATPAMVAGALREFRLTPGPAARDYSDDVPAGQVFQQQPAATTEVPTWTLVSVWYSIGPHPRADPLTVPRVVGLTLARAADSLKRSQLGVGLVDSLRQAGARGTVVHQRPAAGSGGHRGDAVSLWIAVAAPTVPVPALVGLTRAAAGARLDNAGLALGRITLVALADRDSGVVGQTPQAGTPVDSGTLVDVVENRPPERRQVAVPDLAGLTRAAAEQALERDSLYLGLVEEPRASTPGTVVSQAPEARTRVYLHTAVDVVLGARDSTIALVPVPPVVNRTVESARGLLRSAGFTTISIRSSSGTVTSSSLIESQVPLGGTLVPPGAPVALVAGPPAEPLAPVPDLRGLAPADAAASAGVSLLQMAIDSTLRRLRLHDIVVRQRPSAGRQRPPDNTVQVVVEIPLVPPVLAGIGLGLAGLGAAMMLRPRPTPPKPPARPPDSAPLPDVDLHERVRRDPPVALSSPHDSLVREALTMRFALQSGPWIVEAGATSLVRSETPRHD